MNEALEGLRAIGYPALVGGAVLAALGAALSVQVVLNRIALLALTLGQVSAMGIAACLFLEVPYPTLGALGLSLVAAAALGHRDASPRTSAETWLGVLYAFGAAASLLLVSKSAQGKEEVVHLLEGDLLFIRWGQVGLLAGVAALLLFGLLAGMRHLVLVGFDPDAAGAMGYRVSRWRTAILGGVAVAVAAGMETGGLLFTFALLVIPGAAALRLTADLRLATGLAVAFAVACHAVGLLASFHPKVDLPSAPLSVVLLAAGFLGTLATRR